MFTAEGRQGTGWPGTPQRASMGPRLFTAEGRGTHVPSASRRSLQWGRGCSPRKVWRPYRYCPAVAPLQWGRGCSPRKVYRRARCGSMRSACFNGAAVVHRGRCGRDRATGKGASVASMGPRLFTAEGSDVVSSPAKGVSASMGPRLFTAEGSSKPDAQHISAPASMGPRLFTAEGVESYHRSHVPKSLQWGRGCSPRKVARAPPAQAQSAQASMGPRLFTAEGRPTYCVTRVLRFASMGPRLFTAEGGVAAAAGTGLTLASMGPRLFTAEGTESALACTCADTCFNGAAVVHRGRFSLGLCHSCRAFPLQWGRGCSPRKV